MNQIKLKYLDIHGGRAEPIRLALHISGQPFEDIRVPFAEFGIAKQQGRFGQLPFIEIDGKLLTQSNSILRFIGRHADLYPECPWQAALCDEVLDASEDIYTRITATLLLDNDQKRQVRDTLCATAIPAFLKAFEQLLEERGNYMCDGRLTVADLKVFCWLKDLKSGGLDYIPQDLIETHAPKLNEYFISLWEDARIRSYYRQFGI